MPESARTGRDGQSVLRSPRRLLLAALGVICVGLAFAGVFLPGLPTTIFLIAASYLFTRSCPWLEERLFRSPAFRPFLPYVRGDREMPRRARAIALLAMWAAVSLSIASVTFADRFRPWFAGIVVAAAIVGSYFILTFRVRPARSVDSIYSQENSRLQVNKDRTQA